MNRRTMRRKARRLLALGCSAELVAEIARNQMRVRRLWVFENGDWARLTLRPGQSLSHRSGGATDEGVAFDATTWRNVGGEVFADYQRWGRDCDGGYAANTTSRLTGEVDVDVTARWSPGSWMPATSEPIAWFGEYELHDLADNVRRSTWERVEASQWDEYAEAAGY